MNEAIIRSEGVLSGSIVSEGILRGSLSMPVGYEDYTGTLCSYTKNCVPVFKYSSTIT